MKNENGKALHLNQKPLDLMRMIIKASSDEGDVVWEPFGGLFTACRAAADIGRRAFGGEINPYYFNASLERFRENRQPELFGNTIFANKTEDVRMVL